MLSAVDFQNNGEVEVKPSRLLLDQISNGLPAELAVLSEAVVIANWAAPTQVKDEGGRGMNAQSGQKDGTLRLIQPSSPGWTFTVRDSKWDAAALLEQQRMMSGQHQIGQPEQSKRCGNYGRFRCY